MLRNTEWCLCATVYTGINSKMFLNLQQAAPRMSGIDVAVNNMIIALLILHQAAIFVIAGLSVWWDGATPEFWYLKTSRFSKDDAGAIFGLRYLGYFVLLSFVLPASLFVTVEVAKAMQAVFMSWDHGMATFHVATGQWMFCRPKTSSLNEQLGLVRYVFTDKTGTLTQNQMNVVKICYEDVELDDNNGSVGKVVALKAQDQLLKNRHPHQHHHHHQHHHDHQQVEIDNVNNNNNNNNNVNYNASTNISSTVPPSPSSQMNSHSKSDNTKKHQPHVLSLINDSNTTENLTEQQIIDREEQEQEQEYESEQEQQEPNLLRRQSSSSIVVDLDEFCCYLRNLQNDKLHLLLLNMSLCHSVVCFDNPTHPLLKTYEGPSQDELALASSARRNGYVLMNRTSQGMELTLPGRINVVFDLLAELEFSSERQMMSVLVRDGTMDVEGIPLEDEKSGEEEAKKLEQGGEGENGDGTAERYVLFCKGADSAIFNRAASHEKNKKAIRDIMNQLEGLCSMGLRTLVFGYRIIGSRDKREWMERFEAAKCSMGNRAEKIAEVSAQIERDFEILGVVGIEDKLQDAVPETLHFLRQTGITVWMLTGDKRETAVAIAETSKLLDPKTDLIAHIDVTEIAEDDFTPIEQVHARCLEQIELIRKERERDLQIHGRERPLVLVADGVSLKVALEDENVFMDLAIHAKSAVCCRLSPLLKAQLVRLFQARTNETVLAIGDGANDVSMIQASMVGIGIMGLEGSQAELSSAYAIPQFKNLKRLLVVHGRWAWYRTTTCLIYTVFKNAALSLCLFYYSFYSGFSGSTLFESWLLTMFNTFFTQATPVIMGGIDTDVDDDILMNSPELYHFIRTDGEYFNRRTFFMWAVDAVITSAAVFFICWTSMLADNMGEHTGLSLDHYGTMGYLVLLVIVDFYAFITQQLYSTATGFVVFLNFCVIPAIMFAYSAIPVDSSFNYPEIPVEVLSSKVFYIYAWVVNALVVMCLRISFSRLFKRIWPSGNELATRIRVEEKEKQELLKLKKQK